MAPHTSSSFAPIIAGVNKFQTDVYPEKQALFSSLALQQQPKVLFVTCSDSRVHPALITQSEPGSLFIVKNAGNIIPPHGTPCGGTSASIEYAVTVVGVEHIIVCGHSNCGAMKSLMNEDVLNKAPNIIQQWMLYAHTTRALLNNEPDGLSEETRLDRCVEHNVHVQLNHLKTFPSVAARVATGLLTLHGWVYHIESGEVSVYTDGSSRFTPFQEAYA